MAGHSLYIKPIIGPVNFKLPDKYEYQYRLDDECDDEWAYSDDDEYGPDPEQLFEEITKCAPDTTFFALWYSYSSKTMSSYEVNYIFNRNGCYELASQQDLDHYQKEDLLISNPEDDGMLCYVNGELSKQLDKISEVSKVLDNYLHKKQD